MLPVAGRSLAGPQGAIVHLRWLSSVDEGARRTFESQFGLIDGAVQDGPTWRYTLMDPSRANIRAIVSSTAVADTHFLDREQYRVTADAERTPRPQRFGVGGDAIVRSADGAALVLALVGGLLLAGHVPGSIAPAAARSARAAADALGRRLAPWIPALDAHAFGAFRVALGIGLIWVAWERTLTAIPLEQQRHRALVDLDIIHQVAASPDACDVLKVAMLVAAAIFTIGFRPRLAYAGFVAAFTASVLVTLERTSAHDLGLPLVTFLGWLAVPWGASGLRFPTPNPQSPTPNPQSPTPAYGFAIWWPGLTLGAALLAAAYAKLAESGIGWITDGAVKYHFVADAQNARVDWGLWIASHHWAAVLFSFAAIAVEAAFIVNVFARGAWTRLAAGLVGVGLFAGLYLFQGIYWPGWWVLFLAFLPWERLNRLAREARQTDTANQPRARFREQWDIKGEPLAGAQAAAIAVLVATQVYASAERIEAEPLLSNFPMYAHSYASPEQFDESVRWKMTRVVDVRADGQDIRAAIIGLVDNDRSLLIDLAEQRGSKQGTLTERERRDRELLCDRYVRAMGTLPSELTFTIERHGFDWTTGRFREYRRVPTAPVRLAELCHL